MPTGRRTQRLSFLWMQWVREPWRQKEIWIIGLMLKPKGMSFSNTNEKEVNRETRWDIRGKSWSQIDVGQDQRRFDSMGKQKDRESWEKREDTAACTKGFVGFGTVPLLPVAWVSNSAVGSGGMWWRRGVVDGGGVVGASGGGDRRTHTYIRTHKKKYNKKISSQVGNHSLTEGVKSKHYNTIWSIKHTTDGDGEAEMDHSLMKHDAVHNMHSFKRRWSCRSVGSLIRGGAPCYGSLKYAFAPCDSAFRSLDY